jgi:hypothetical protein
MSDPLSREQAFKALKLVVVVAIWLQLLAINMNLNAILKAIQRLQP